MAEFRDWSVTASANTGASADGFFKENMQYSEVNDAAREFQAILARDRKDKNGTLVAGGSTSSYVLSISASIGSYRDGDYFRFRAPVKNIGATTLQIASLSAMPVVKTDLTALSGGEIRAGGIYEAFYNSASANFQMVNIPTGYYQAGDVRQYGADPTGAVDCAQAIADAFSATGIALFIDGTYVSSTITLANSGSYTFIGQNATLKLEDAADALLISGGASTGTGLVDYVEIRGLTIDGNKANQDAGWFGGVVKLYARQVKIVDNVFTGGSGSVCWIAHISEYAEIRGNALRDGKEHSGTLNENSTYIALQTEPNKDTSTLQYINISDNFLYGITAGTTGHGVAGINVASDSGQAVDDTHRVIIANNVLHNCGQDAAGNVLDAISIYRRGGRSVIEGNVIYDGDYGGIRVQGSDNVVISNNTVHGVVDRGIWIGPRDGTISCSDIVISDNAISSCDTGIGATFSSGLEARNLSITGNIIRDVVQAVNADYVDGAIIFANNIVENVAAATGAAAGARAVDFLQCDADITIVGNNLKDSENAWISVRNCAGSVIVSDNNIVDSTDTPLKFRDTTGDILIDGNVMGTVPTAGVEFNTCSGRNVVRGNVSVASSTITLAGGSTVLTQDNVGFAAETQTGAGAVDPYTPVTLVVSTGTDALTLADGLEGQRKTIVMKTDGGVATLTPTNLYNGSTITFDDVGDSAGLIFTDGQWVWLGGTATLA